MRSVRIFRQLFTDILNFHIKEVEQAMKYQLANRVSALKPSIIREILKNSSDPDMIAFSAGNPAPEAFPVAAVQEISARILKDNPILALQPDRRLHPIPQHAEKLHGRKAQQLPPGSR